MLNNCVCVYAFLHTSQPFLEFGMSVVFQDLIACLVLQHFVSFFFLPFLQWKFTVYRLEMPAVPVNMIRNEKHLRAQYMEWAKRIDGRFVFGFVSAKKHRHVRGLCCILSFRTLWTSSFKWYMTIKRPQDEQNAKRKFEWDRNVKT